MRKPTISRVRPSDPEWPSEASWNRLNQEVGGQLIKVQSPLVTCMDAPSRLNCTYVFRQLKNPYYLGDEVGLTQTLGWVGAWTSRPSTYAVAARTTQDVVAAVNFARENNLRIVVKGGGHSYQGTSNSVDSLQQIAFRPGNVLEIKMVFQGLDHQQAETIWQPFFDWVTSAPQDYSIVSAPVVVAIPAKHYWNPKERPAVLLADDRADSPAASVFWTSNLEEVGMVLHGYQSAWIPVSLLQANRQGKLVDSLFAAARHWEIVLHVNKGLAGAPAAAIDAAKNTAMNPAVLDAFALIICAAAEPPAYPNIPGREPDFSAARGHVEAIERAMNEIRKALPSVGSYLAESNFFDEAWRESFWGTNYARLLAVKDKYDPDGLFFVHHGVGSERWSADGFTRMG